MNMNHQWLSDPELFQINRLPATSSHHFYTNKEGGSFVHSLNGTWKFHYANSLNEIISGFEKEGYDCEEWDDIQVPGHIQLQGYGTPMYVNQVYPWSGKEQLIPPEIPKWNPVGSYVTYFDSTVLMDNTNTRMIFHGVESGMALWINGNFVGYSEDSFTPSSFDITKFIKEGINKVAVNVYRFTSGSWLEDQDFWRFSGIFRDVELVSIPCVHVNDLKITQDTSNLDRPSIQVHTDVISDGFELIMSLYDPNNRLLETKKTTESDITFIVEEPLLWSAEKPYLYHLEIEVIKENQLIEFIKEKIGIRRFEMKDGIMLLNGRRIVFHGVDRHEFCCESGRVVSYETTKQDIINMKENNINSIRTSHYPNQTFLYDLCDEYGLYVIDEVNLETHGTWSEMYDPKHIIPNDRPEWKKNLLDRANSMYERDKNHSSILIWSCGNESYGGEDIYEMSEYLRKKDPSRLVHYEGVHNDPRYPDTTDIYSEMYTPASEIESFLKEHTDKPFILCEYAHAMGNSNGALYKYTDLEKKYPNYQGGFIWDYVDQALLCEGKLYYGGDYHERPSDYDFCGNGIMFADRTPTPKLQEVKYCYQFIDTLINEKVIHIQNNYLFTDLNEFDVVITLSRNGDVVETKHLNIQCEPGKAIEVNNPYQIDDDGEYSVLVSYQKDKYEYAHEQYVYPFKTNEKHSNKKIRITEDYLNIGVVGDNFNVIFSKQKGLVSYKVNSYEFIRQPLRPNFFRASTNNDVENGYGHRYGEWLINSLYPKCHYQSVIKSNDHFIINYDCELPLCKDNKLHIQYEVYGDGEIVVDIKLDKLKDHIEMPAFGMLIQTYKELDKVSYYGAGPEENYIDRDKGTVLGKYSYDVDDNLTPYLYPQECGNRTSTRFFTVSSSHHSITVSGNPFEFSVLRYTPYELENAKHQWELPNVYQTVISINEKQMGVAGDNTWGAKTHDEFLLDKQEHHLRISLKGK